VSSHEATFDPDHTLLRENIRLVNTNSGRVLEVTIICPKECKDGKPTVVDLLESRSALCPVTAFWKWSKIRKPEEGLPVELSFFGSYCGLQHVESNRLMAFGMDPGCGV